MTPQVATLPLHSGGGELIGAILIRQGKLRPEDIERVLHAQKQGGSPFGQTAKSLGLISATDVEMALSLQFQHHYAPPDQTEYPPQLFAARDTQSEEAKALGTIRTYLLQNWFDRGHVSLTIAGSDSGEGTSLFAANLAVAFAQLGQRTLLIDANLREPRQHEIFHLHGRLGLSDVLARRAGVETFSMIDSFPQLSVLPAGTVPPNPLELVSRPAFSELIRSLTGRFDVVLVDAPPFSSGSDAMAIGRHMDGALLVCRKDRTRFNAVRAIRAQLSRSDVKVVGSVFLEF